MASHLKILLALLVLQMAGTGCRREQMQPIGPDVNKSFVIYFKGGATGEDINAFFKQVLSRPHPEGRGHYLLEGVDWTSRVQSVQGHEAIAVTFSANATVEQKETLIRAVKSSPFVYRVLENVAPAEVKTIE
jgi:hypothetical protein